MDPSLPLLETRDVSVRFPVRGRGTLRAVDGVSLAVFPGQTLALAGESGCGKTTLARVAGLLVPPTSGAVRVLGEDRGSLGRRGLKAARRRVQMVFQDPFGSLNPRLPVGTIIAEPLVVHGIGSREGRRDRVLQVAEAVGLLARDLGRYPHELSGGQRQRVAIARALAPRPDLIVADEPVSALDMSIQGQILNLFADLQEAQGIAYLLVSHSLPTVRHLAHRVAVMYLGRVVEAGPAREVLEGPRHPYTQALVASVPAAGSGKRKPGRALPGEPPSPLCPPPGCAFHPRCRFAQEVCRELSPELAGLPGSADHQVSCHFRGEVEGYR